MTFTSGFRASMASRADSALYWPTRFVLCIIWRCRLLSSTTSASIMPLVPFVLLAHIYNNDLLIARAALVLVCQHIIHLRRRPLRHLPPCLAHNLARCITHVSSPFGMLTKLIY